MGRVEGLSADYHLSPGATDRALRRYRAFVDTPGRRPLYPQDAEWRRRLAGGRESG